MKIITDERALDQITADASLVFVYAKKFDHAWIKDASQFEVLGFEGKNDQTFFDTQHKILYYGLESFDVDTLREACAKALKMLKKYTFQTIKCGILDKKGKEYKTAIKAMLFGFLLGDYVFDMYKSKKESSKLEKIVMSLETYSGVHVMESDFQTLYKECEGVSSAVNLVRRWVNTSPEEATPAFLADEARTIAKEFQLECQIHDEDFLKKEGMNAFYAVSRASIHEPYLIHLTYKPKNPQKKVVIVGKGLTYDSGGLSLKPSDYMVTMKADKSGGCAAMGIIAAVAQLGLNVEVHAVVGATENMIGGNAFKPDDVLVAKNGKTIEVRNTDAEGRLVLCDCLCYAQEIDPDYIIDLATLTGACVVALGEYTSGVLGYNEKLKKKFIKSATKSGELAVSLPFNRHLRKLIDSKVADVCNISSARYGGAITAGLFLGEFIEDRYKDCWLHLDIAGPAYVEKEWDVNTFGASGAGVRMVVEFLKNMVEG